MADDVKKNRGNRGAAGMMEEEKAHEAEHKTRGGTHAQHVKAGHAGGAAPHVCRGRECEKKGEK